jgi:hypothetical protein
MRLDNATLLARRVYMTDLDLFDQVWRKEGENLPAAVARIISLARSNAEDPYAALEEWLLMMNAPTAPAPADGRSGEAASAPRSDPSAAP